MSQPRTPPKVKQCTDPEHDKFGCVAVEAQDQITGAPRPGVWFIGNPAHGGHWGTDDEVADWADAPPKRKA